MEDILQRLGLLAVFVGAAVEGDFTLIATGVLSRLGVFHLATAIGVGALGGFCGDVTCYAIGRHRATAIRESRIYRRHGATIDRLAERIGPWQILLARFLYGTRIASMVFWGTRRLPFWKFAAIDLVGCFVSATGLAGLGYVLSESAVALRGHVHTVQLGLLGVAATTALGFVLWRFVRRARRS